MEILEEHQIQIATPTPNIVPFDAASGLNTNSALPGLEGVLGSNLGANNDGGLGLAINSPTAFSTSVQATVQEEDSPTALGLFA
ncbi:hypothetical protein ElyMa_002302200 [Elysia marginata]|uniref:Uncharacterized protein n=1 Tax=Elysia marginata TaxID=1093978 RepID=A0AAV4G3N1_9GAST|nr:hypothetical protein ElyMa_002302200 [Elysia marginata]